MFRKLNFMFVFLFILFAGFAVAEPANQNLEFIRLVKANDMVVALQTATVTYQKDNKTVDLIGVVHIGDRKYYERLNKQFESYDSLCYELVADKGTKVSNKRKGGSSVGSMQDFMSNMLKLEHQLDIVDYDARNFVHADVSPDEMAKLMAQRGDTQLTIILKVVAEMLQQENLKAQNAQNETFQIDPLELLVNPNYLKRMLAQNLANSNEHAIGPTLHQLLVVDRNKVAMKVVEQELKTKNKVGIFYGAAHLPDFSKRLLDLGFKPVETKWNVAWNMYPTKEEMIMKMLKKMLED